jgi:hypothetical protein
MRAMKWMNLPHIDSGGNIQIHMYGLGQHTYWVLLVAYMGPRATHIWLGIVVVVGLQATDFTQGIAVGLCGASGTRLYWVLVCLCHGASGNTHFSGYGSCWFLWGTVVGYKCMLPHGQHILLGIVVGLWWATDNTLYWVLLWVMRGFR